MSIDKVFEALEILSRALEFNDEGNFQSGRLWRLIFNDMVDDKEKATIEEALIELKAIKEAKPSEALRCLEELRSNLGVIYDDTLNTIEQALLKAQDDVANKKSNVDKMLEIVKEKDVDMYSLRRCETVEEYNIHFVIDEYQRLTQDEFDLLKHYLEKNIQKQ